MRIDLVFVGLMAAIAVAFPLADAHAYLDPGTSSFILQMLLGGVAGAAVVGKMYWARFKEVIARTFGGNSSAKDNAENDQ